MKSPVKRFSLLLIVLSLTRSIGAHGQNTQIPDTERARAVVQRLQQISSDLNLTEDQKEKIRPIILKEAPKLKALQDDTSLSRGQKLLRLRTILNGTNTQLKPILTPDQAKRLRQIRDDEIRKRLSGSNRTHQLNILTMALWLRRPQ
jgi:hypothetical protein